MKEKLPNLWWKSQVLWNSVITTTQKCLKELITSYEIALFE